MNLFVVLLAAAGHLAPAPFNAVSDKPPPPVVAHNITPPRRTRTAVAHYPPEAREAKQEGNVTVSYDIGIDGSVSNVAVKTSSGFPLLDAAAVIDVAAWRYEPATDNGKPVAAPNRVVVINFSLPKDDDVDPVPEGSVKLGKNCAEPHGLTDEQIVAACTADRVPGLSKDDQTRARLNLGYALLGLKRYDEAFSIFDIAVVFADRSAMAYAGRAYASVFLKHPDRAYEDLTKALELEPKNAEYLMRRGAVLTALGRYPEAIADLDHALARSPGNKNIYTTRGIAKQRSGDAAGAQADFDAAKAADDADEGDAP